MDYLEPFQSEFKLGYNTKVPWINLLGNLGHDLPTPLFNLLRYSQSWYMEFGVLYFTIFPLKTS